MAVALGRFRPVSSGQADEPTFDAQTLEFVEREVRPLLVERCFKCHGNVEQPKGGLKLVDRAAVLQGGDSGPAAVPGKPAESYLIETIGYRDAVQMPPDGKLSDAQIATLTKWVELGLPWPASSRTRPWPLQGRRRLARLSNHRGAAAVLGISAGEGRAPAAGRGSRLATVRDRPLHSCPAGAGPLAACPGGRPADADSPSHVRFDRPAADPGRGAGLPGRFVGRCVCQGGRPVAGLAAIWRAVGPALARRGPVYRLWRCARSGAELPVSDVKEAWRYRDWVVGAMNRDLPYDRFIIDQIAGDLVEPASPDKLNVEGTIATGFLAVGPWGNGDADKEKMLTDIVDDQLNVTSRAFLGLTVTCARCHDHKFDPIPTADYYSLAGIFYSTHIIPDVGAKDGGCPDAAHSPAVGQRVGRPRGRQRPTGRVEDAGRERFRARLSTAGQKPGRPNGALSDGRLGLSTVRPAGWRISRSSNSPRPAGSTARLLAQWTAYLGLGDPKLLSKSVADADGVRRPARLDAGRGPAAPGLSSQPDRCPRSLPELVDPSAFGGGAPLPHRQRGGGLAKSDRRRGANPWARSPTAIPTVATASAGRSSGGGVMRARAWRPA